MTEPAPASGSTAAYCSAYPIDGHGMVARSGGSKVRFVEICQYCGWIDGAALDAYADNAVKESLTARAGRIAVAVETEPFRFIQPSSGNLPLREILLQALAAAYHVGVMTGVNGPRMLDILNRTQSEVERLIRLGAEGEHNGIADGR